MLESLMPDHIGHEETLFAPFDLMEVKEGVAV